MDFLKMFMKEKTNLFGHCVAWSRKNCEQTTLSEEAKSIFHRLVAAHDQVQAKFGA